MYAAGGMRRRWYYWKRAIRENRPLIGMMVLGLLAAVWLFGRRGLFMEKAAGFYKGHGILAAERILEDWFPAAADGEKKGDRGKPFLFSWISRTMEGPERFDDPAYERFLAERSGKGSGADGSPGPGITGDPGTNMGGSAGSGAGNGLGTNAGGSSGGVGGTGTNAAGSSGPGAAGTPDTALGPTGEVIAMKPAGSGIIREKLADYDYVMQNFYSVHPTTTAGRDMMDAARFLKMDLSIEKDPENPQILIYHTHSQEEFADYPENPEARITGVGEYLKELLEEKGYVVIHDTGVYDFKDGKLDRSSAYTYALDGITGILQENPSIQVVLDIHRDGVEEGTRLVTEVNGKPTAKIMFFNGTSQSPDGPIEYLPNPNREANMAFSFQMQLKAAGEYPGFTRKIYLKGLRYNQHVRARTALIEVGAQTNTFEEAKNAMEPLAELLDQVLSGENDSDRT